MGHTHRGRADSLRRVDGRGTSEALGIPRAARGQTCASGAARRLIGRSGNGRAKKDLTARRFLSRQNRHGDAARTQERGDLRCGSAIGGAVARAFAREGARLFLTGRSLASIVGIAAKIGAAGGVAEAAQVDARDEQAIESHLDTVVRKTGRIESRSPTPSASTSEKVYRWSIFARGFSVPDHRVEHDRVPHRPRGGPPHEPRPQRSGVIRTSMCRPGHEALAAGFGPACASILTISRTLAAELGPCGVRVLCLQPNAVPESTALLRGAVGQQADGFERSPDEHLSSIARATLMGRLPTLEEVANVAAFVASDRASAMTGTIVKINCGAQVD